MKRKASDCYHFFRFTPEKAWLVLVDLPLAAFEGFLRGAGRCLPGSPFPGVISGVLFPEKDAVCLPG